METEERFYSSNTQPQMGKLKIFFGYAAGVGKTYAMLEAAHRAKAQGIDVVVGYVERHTRPDTLALLEGLEQIPAKQIDYKGIHLKEFDLDAALQRHPQLLLVDELAHSNAQGCRHAKRYQDVEEVLRSGIDVYTTVNVQHWQWESRLRRGRKRSWAGTPSAHPPGSPDSEQHRNCSRPGSR